MNLNFFKIVNFIQEEIIMESNIVYIGNNIHHAKALEIFGNSLGLSVFIVPKDHLDFVNFLKI